MNAIYLAVISIIKSQIVYSLLCFNKEELNFGMYSYYLFYSNSFLKIRTGQEGGRISKVQNQ